MGRAKPLSFDEKRKRLLEFFYEKKGVFNLKGLEKTASKEKGIVSQSMKEVLQSLVDDNLVDSDKIGSGNFFWALPSKALVTRENKVKVLKEEVATLEPKVEEAKSRKRKLEDERVDEERDTKLARYESLKENIEEQNVRLKKYADSDPDTVKERNELTEQCKVAANRWTDNIYELLSKFKNMRPDLKESDILKHFGLPTEFDYVE